MWSDIILSYCKSQGLHSISLGQLYDSELCNNQSIKRRLSMNDIKAVGTWMQNNKFGDFTSDSKEKIFVYWRPIQEVAQAIHTWADNTGRIGSVETIIDLTDDPANKNELFFKLPIEIVMKACSALQEVGKAQVFYSDNTDTHGVKFFNI